MLMRAGWGINSLNAPSAGGTPPALLVAPARERAAEDNQRQCAVPVVAGACSLPAQALKAA